ncbi:hypothetical protein LZ31DRAFT_571314 [Colletotrichum somersetense]|nr:hypothetical protein LZ31DRAFT_571314 [Colletotrichum somersetense]
MRLSLYACCIGGAALVAARPSLQGASSNVVTYLERREPEHNNASDIPPNKNIPAFQTDVLVDGEKSAGKRDSSGLSLPSLKGDLVTRATSEEVSSLQVRQAEIAAVIVAGSVILVTAAAFGLALKALDGITDFSKARKTFTTTQTEEMWKRNPDYNKFPAAACYSLGYRLANPAGFSDLAQIDVSSALNSETYDCMFLEAPNQFFTNGDGGSLNVSV